VNKPSATVKADIPPHFRRLKAHELVSLGDFVANEHQRLEMWEGPSGFRADSFVKAMYRRVAGHAVPSKKEIDR